jgi:hypothetical protein
MVSQWNTKEHLEAWTFGVFETNKTVLGSTYAGLESSAI